VTQRRLLVAVYDYPPSTSVGGARWVSMKRHLERLGYDVMVLTTDAYGRLPDDEAEQVVRAPDLVASEPLRRVLRRPELPRPGKEVSVDRPPSPLLTKVAVPDIYAVSWVPAAVRAARRVIRTAQVDAFISTSPKDSTHLVGLAIPRATAAWVADFRDGWVFESTRPPFPTTVQRALDRRLEALVVRKADAVVAFSDVLVEDFAHRFGRDIDYVPNGWDPDLAVGDAAAAPAQRRAVRLVYTGTLTGAEGAPTDRTPQPLLEALDALADEDPALVDRIELLVLGRLTERDERLLARYEHLGVVSHIGYVPRPTALAAQRSADALILVSSPTPSSIPLKLFEYLGADRPILHVGRPGAAERVLAETGAGVTVSPDDRAAIIEQLRRIATLEFAETLGPRDVGRYTYPVVAERMADVIERAIQRNQGHAR
jgi:Glycosyl transferase 4-like domain/Glycosyl transferases group 1